MVVVVVVVVEVVVVVVLDELVAVLACSNNFSIEIGVVEEVGHPVKIVVALSGLTKLYKIKCVIDWIINWIVNDALLHQM